MSILSNFVKEYIDKYTEKEQVFEQGLVGDIKKISAKLLDDKFLPSVQLKSTLAKQLRRARYPMEIAITGQFSSGKSTFLNALLSRNILPTGITPVTSKVNFINYGEEYKLRITYYSGAQEYAPIEAIADFTDQRKDEMSDIKYLTLYAPMDILKDISFVDTPGLNSQSQSDTDTTRRVLRDVGGIIWLTLIDNAGKMSEAQVLEEYMGQFKNKSLCVLNQKDKFTQEQIDRTTNYVKDKFGDFFAEVTPISAKMALESRSHHKDVLIQDQQDKLLKNVKTALSGNVAVIADDFDKYYEAVDKINNLDTSNNDRMSDESNIQEVLDFIESTIRPQAAEAKEYAIKKDLRNICDIIINEYTTIIGVYESLSEILRNSQDDILEEFDDIHKTNSKKLFNVFNSIEAIMEKMSHEIFKNIKKQDAHRFEAKSGFLSKKNKFQKVQYDTYWIDSDNIYKNLFYDDQMIDKLFKRAIKELKGIEVLTDQAYRDIFADIQNRVHRWQEPYELMRKHREIASDLEFSLTRHFAAKVYENVLSSYYNAMLENISALRKKFAYFNGALSYSYIQITQSTVAHFEQQISESTALYEQEPTKFSINIPREHEILTKLKANFGFEKIEDFLTSKRNYLYKITQYSKKQYIEINVDRVNFVESRKETYENKIEDLKQIKEEI